MAEMEGLVEERMSMAENEGRRERAVMRERRREERKAASQVV